jgi:hypothetical protein
VAALATPAELATYLQTATQAEYDAGNPDALDTLRAQFLLDKESAAIRAFCGWSITQETVTARRVYPRGGYLNLYTKRLTAFTMTIGGVAAVDGTDFAWEIEGPGRVQILRYLTPTSVVLGTWTHGYATAPEPLVEACCERAAARYVNPSLHRSEHIDDVVTVYGLTPLSQDERVTAYKLAGVA